MTLYSKENSKRCFAPCDPVTVKDGRCECNNVINSSIIEDNDYNFKQDLLDFLNKRINWYSGGEDMKSLKEIAIDNNIVSELIDIRNFILNKIKP